jgi:L-lysine exporter family protein LysE/ArgO
MIVSGLTASAIGALTGFIASLIGWQINLLAINRGLSRGRHAAFFVGMGAAAADLIFIFIALAGVMRFLHHERFWPYLKWLGVAMILIVALRTLLKKKSFSNNDQPKKKRNPAKNFLLGFLVVGANPVIFLVWIGVISFLVTHFPGARIVEFRWFFLMSFFVGAAIWFFILAQAVLHGAKNWDERHLHLASKVSAVGLVLVAIFLIFERF